MCSFGFRLPHCQNKAAYKTTNSNVHAQIYAFENPYQRAADCQLFKPICYAL